MDNPVQLQRKKNVKKRGPSPTAEVDDRTGQKEVQMLWGMLNVDDACIISRSSKGLERMLPVIATACAAFGLTVYEENTEIICLQTKRGGKVSFTMDAASQVYKQTMEFVYMGRSTTADRDLSTEMRWRPGRAFNGTRWKSIIASACVYG